ncbi:Inosose dehydratase [Paenibacillus polymyxa E681]|uniref:sugar phosphate isomerase/epimerase family protein n=1 Tax=Paenibacillus polymyxa TaxID=1406 RepID=UPI0001E31700|nr:sugar phosphate isomerase/epimerase [Paenibacillus polymyxa]ADM68708.1 sugar phosphate isomerase [Paenibacillus polymyxa E681]QNV55714.1 Inosose dehydratase [Paenibacillus polymyxa E681]QNV60550.1 Inosose dehydratase [Paenibacillus polymyxa E681]URJ46964.1 sugar phosphate isomerase/epimerase [Paenibacillus polymyxa]
MLLGYQTNTWGGVIGHPAGVTSVKDLYYLAGGSTEQAAHDISEAGYKGIELFDGNLMQYEDKLQEFQDLLFENDLKLIGVYTGGNFIYKDILEDEFSKIEKVAKLASQLGAEHLVIGGGAVRSGGIRESDYEALARGLDQAASIAQKYNLIPSYHPHLGTICETPEQLDKIMGLTSINLCPDTAHIEAGGGDPVEVIRQYKDRIKYVHFKDYSSGSFLPLGAGHQNFSEMVSLLRDMNYNGWITIELDSYEDPKAGAVISKRYLAETLNLM